MFGLGAREAAVAAILGDSPVRGLSTDPTTTTGALVEMALGGLDLERSTIVAGDSVVAITTHGDDQVAAGTVAQRIVSLAVAHGMTVRVEVRSGT